MHGIVALEALEAFRSWFTEINENHDGSVFSVYILIQLATPIIIILSLYPIQLPFYFEPRQLQITSYAIA